MNRRKSIAFVAVIAAFAITSIGLTGVSATPLMVSSVIPQSQENVGMLGHVEYTLKNDGQVKGYYQLDNVVVDDGKDCASMLLFGATNSGTTCQASPNAFNFIAIGNGSATTFGSYEDINQLTNATDTNDDGCADSGAEEGELARISATVTIPTPANAGGTEGTKVQLVTSSDFDFVTANATLVNESAIYNSAQRGGGVGDDGCIDAGDFGNTWNMFAIQALNSGNGIAVTDGDSLSVKWTITVG